MAQMIEVKVPDIGDFKDVEIIEVLVKPGDRVEKEASLITLESDKATIEIPSPQAGVVKELRIKIGDKVSQGSPILVLEESAGTAAASPSKPKPAPAAPIPTPAPVKPAAPEPTAAAFKGTADVTCDMLVLGSGLGMTMQIPIMAIQNSVERRYLGIATSVANFFRSMGGSFGVAIFGAVLSNRLAHYLPLLLPPEALGRFDVKALQASPAQVRALPPAIQNGIVEAIARSLHTVFLTALPAAALAFVVALLLRERPLRKVAHIGADPSGEAPEVAAAEVGPGGG